MSKRVEKKFKKDIKLIYIQNSGFMFWFGKLLFILGVIFSTIISLLFFVLLLLNFILGDGWNIDTPFIGEFLTSIYAGLAPASIPNLIIAIAPVILLLVFYSLSVAEYYKFSKNVIFAIITLAIVIAQMVLSLFMLNFMGVNLVVVPLMFIWIPLEAIQIIGVILILISYIRKSHKVKKELGGIKPTKESKKGVIVLEKEEETITEETPDSKPVEEVSVAQPVAEPVMVVPTPVVEAEPIPTPTPVPQQINVNITSSVPTVSEPVVVSQPEPEVEAAPVQEVESVPEYQQPVETAQVLETPVPVQEVPTPEPQAVEEIVTQLTPGTKPQTSAKKKKHKAHKAKVEVNSDPNALNDIRINITDGNGKVTKILEVETKK